MATNLEKRITDLETKAASTDHRVRLYFRDEEEDDEQARLNAGIPPDYKGSTICAVFVSSPNALKEQPNGND
jgi:hypothetical protein